MTTRGLQSLFSIILTVIVTAHLRGQVVQVDDMRLHGELYQRTSGTEGLPDVAATGSAFAVVWSEDRPDFSFDIMMRRVDDRGNPVGPVIRCNEAPIATAYSRPRIAWASVTGAIGDPGGRYLVVWQETDSMMFPERISGRLIDREGLPVGSTIRLDGSPYNGRSSDPAVAPVPGTAEFMVAWVDRLAGGRVVTARVGAGGAGPPMLVQDTMPLITVSGATIDVGGPLGKAIIAWAETDPYVYGLRQVRGRLLDDGGRPLTEAFRVDSLVPSAFSPSVSMAGDGTFAIVYETVIAGRWEIRAQRFEGNGIKREGPITPTMGAEGANAPDVCSNVGQDAYGYGATIVWREPAPGQPEGRLRAQTFDGRGELDGASLIVDSSDNGVGAPVAVAGVGVGNVNPRPTRLFTVWPESLARGISIHGRCVQSGEPFSPIVVIDNDSGGAAQRSSAIDAAADGFHVVVFEDDRNGPRQIRFTRIAADGSLLEADRPVVDTPDAVDRSQPDVIVFDDHSFAIVWAERIAFDGSSIRCTLFDPSGRAVRGAIDVTEGASGDYPSVAGAPGNGIVVLWRSPGEGGIQGRWFDDNVTPRGPAFRVDGDTNGASFTGPDVATTSDGGFVAVWSDDRLGDYDIVGRAFRPDGFSDGPDRFVTQRYPIDTTQQIWPAIAVTPDDEVVVAWLDYRLSTKYGQVRGRRFDGGAATGDVFDISDRSTPARGLCLECREEPPAIAATCRSQGTAGDRSFVVSWSTPLDDGGDVVARYYPSSDGRAEAPSITTSAPNGTLQFAPALARDAEGGVYFAWDENRNLDPDNWDIWGNVIDWRGASGGVERGPTGVDDCSILPNPAPGIAVLTVDIPHAGNVVVVFYGIDGAEAWRFNAGEREPGKGEILLDFQSLTGSLYLIDVEVDERRCATTTVIRKF